MKIIVGCNCRAKLNNVFTSVSPSHFEVSDDAEMLKKVKDLSEASLVEAKASI